MKHIIYILLPLISFLTISCADMDYGESENYSSNPYAISEPPSDFYSQVQKLAAQDSQSGYYAETEKVDQPANIQNNSPSPITSNTQNRSQSVPEYNFIPRQEVTKRCYSCNGSGSCKHCGGNGIMPGTEGMQIKIPCGACRSGKCRWCNGVGTKTRYE